MVYITLKQQPCYRQMTLEEFLFETDHKPRVINNNSTNTRTYTTNSLIGYAGSNPAFAATV